MYFLFGVIVLVFTSCTDSLPISGGDQHQSFAAHVKKSLFYPNVLDSPIFTEGTLQASNTPDGNNLFETLQASKPLDGNNIFGTQASNTLDGSNVFMAQLPEIILLYPGNPCSPRVLPGGTLTMGPGVGCDDASGDATPPPPVVQPPTPNPNLNNRPDSSNPGLDPQTNLETKPNPNVDIGLPTTSPGPGSTPQTNIEKNAGENNANENNDIVPGQSTSPVSPGSENGPTPAQSRKVRPISSPDVDLDGSTPSRPIWNRPQPKGYGDMNPLEQVQEMIKQHLNTNPPNSTPNEPPPFP